MLIDWFTVSAQILNFGVLLWLLRRFLYVPILDAIDKRSQQIENNLAASQATKSRANEQLDLYQKKRLELEQQEQSILKAARTRADTKSEFILSEAHNKADKIHQQRQQDLQTEIDQIHQQITQSNLQEVFKNTEKLLSDLADVNVLEPLFNKFCEKLIHMSKQQKSLLIDALKEPQNSIQLNSAFALDNAQKKQFEQHLAMLLKEQSIALTNIVHHLNPDLILGVEICVGGFCFSWHGKDYLENLQHLVRQKLIQSQQQGSEDQNPSSVSAQSTDIGLPDGEMK